jgi:hypothetical protein
MKNFIYYNSVAAIPVTRWEQRRRPLKKTAFQRIRYKIYTRINKKKPGEVLK